MIKSIENDNIRIGSAQDLFSSVNLEVDGFVGRFKLPLFSAFPKLINIDDVENYKNPICFVIKRDFYRYNNIMESGLPLSLVEYINKTWNEFYEESTRK